MPYDAINENVNDLPDCSCKVAAEFYVDDRAMPFNGSYNEVLGQVPTEATSSIVGGKGQT